MQIVALLFAFVSAALAQTCDDVCNKELDQQCLANHNGLSNCQPCPTIPRNELIPPPGNGWMEFKISCLPSTNGKVVTGIFCTVRRSGYKLSRRAPAVTFDLPADNATMTTQTEMQRRAPANEQPGTPLLIPYPLNKPGCTISPGLRLIQTDRKGNPVNFTNGVLDLVIVLDAATNKVKLYYLLGGEPVAYKDFDPTRPAAFGMIVPIPSGSKSEVQSIGDLNNVAMKFGLQLDTRLLELQCGAPQTSNGTSPSGSQTATSNSTATSFVSGTSTASSGEPTSTVTNIVSTITQGAAPAATGNAPPTNDGTVTYALGWYELFVLMGGAFFLNPPEF